MTPDPAILLKKIRRLSQALLVSGAFNVGVLALLSYWLVRERPPTPYCELKPATYAQQQAPLADTRGSSEVISSLRNASFDQLVTKLKQAQLVEDGYTERDLALSCLVAFYHFDITRALPKDSQAQQKRVLMWKDTLTGEVLPLTVYPGLDNQQFEFIIHFAKTERWPLTPQGLFMLLQSQKINLNIDPSLMEAFMLTPEFLTVEWLFNRIEVPIRKQRLLEVVLEGTWPLLKQFIDQQRQLNDLSAARRQKFLLDYIDKGSEAAAYLLIEIESEFAIKKLDDAQVIAVLQGLPHKTVESEHFALALLTSPRSTSVWQQASLRLYEYAGERIPENWNYKTSLLRFAPHKVAPEPNLKLASAALPKSIVEENPIVPKPVNKPLENQKPLNHSRPISSKPKATVKPIESNSVQPNYRLYIVQEGDSLWKISRRFGVGMEVIKERNRLKSNAIKPGIVLKIP